MDSVIPTPKQYTEPYDYDLVILVTAMPITSDEALSFPCLVNE